MVPMCVPLLFSHAFILRSGLEGSVDTFAPTSVLRVLCKCCRPLSVCFKGYSAKLKHTHIHTTTNTCMQSYTIYYIHAHMHTHAHRSAHTHHTLAHQLISKAGSSIMSYQYSEEANDHLQWTAGQNGIILEVKQ